MDGIRQEFPLSTQHLRDDAITAAKLGPNSVTPDDQAACDTASTISGTNAEGTASSFARSDHNHALPNFGTWFPNPTAGQITSVAPGANNAWYAQIIVLHKATLTGINYIVGATSNGNVRCALYDSAGTRVANRTTNAAQATANTYQKVAFDGTYAAVPGVYFASLVLSSATGTWYASNATAPSGAAAGPGSGATLTSLTPPTTPSSSLNATPVMSTY